MPGAGIRPLALHGIAGGCAGPGPADPGDRAGVGSQRGPHVLAGRRSSCGQRALSAPAVGSPGAPPRGFEPGSPFRPTPPPPPGAAQSQPLRVQTLSRRKALPREFHFHPGNLLLRGGLDSSDVARGGLVHRSSQGGGAGPGCSLDRLTGIDAHPWGNAIPSRIRTCGANPHFTF